MSSQVDLKGATLEMMDNIMKMVEEDFEHVPVLMIIADMKQKGDDGKDMYAVVLINPADRDAQIQEALDKLKVKEYGVIMHANSYFLPTEKATPANRALASDPDWLRKHGEKRDMVCATLIDEQGGRMIGARTYTRKNGKVVWEEKDYSADSYRTEVASRYTNSLIREEDFTDEV